MSVGLITVVISYHASELLITCLIGLAVACVVYAVAAGLMSFEVDVWSPWVLYPVAFIVYYGLGSSNLVTYRGYVPSSVWYYYAIGLLGYFGGCILGKVFKWTSYRATTVSRPMNSHGRRVSRLLFGTGLFAALLAYARYGIPALSPLDRQNVSAYLLYFCDLMFIGVGVLMATNLEQGRLMTREVILLFSLAMLMSVGLGYRTPVLMFLLAILVLSRGHMDWRKEAKMLTLGLVGVILLAGLLLYPRFQAMGAGTWSEVVAQTGLPSELGFLAPFVVTFREGPALFYRLTELMPSQVDFLHGKLLFADTLTILPGHKVTGGLIMAQMLNGTGRAGLAPSVIGGAFADFGTAGIVAYMGVQGFLLTWCYRWAATGNRYNRLLYGYSLAIAFQFLYRGVFTPSYIWHIGWLIVARWLVMHRENVPKILESRLLT